MNGRTVSLRGSEGEPAPRIYVHAQGLGEPSYARSINSRGESEVLLSGFGPGRFTVSADPIGSYGNAPKRELVFDGINDQTIELDLR